MSNDRFEQQFQRAEAGMSREQQIENFESQLHGLQNQFHHRREMSEEERLALEGRIEKLKTKLLDLGVNPDQA